MTTLDKILDFRNWLNTGFIKKVPFIAVAAFVSAVVYTEIFPPESHRHYSQLKKDIRVEADVNQDQFISHQEWADVYRIVRPKEHYDSRNPPSNLSIDEMEDYLKIKSLEVEK